MPIPSLERISPACHLMRLHAQKAGWEQWFLLSSDRHHDNTHCDHDTERRHLQEAQRRNAAVFDIGDLFCAMQGKWDRRADPMQLRPELRTGSYLDRLVSYNSEFYEPYAKQIAFLSSGNHETGILRHHETNLTERLAERLRSKGSPVQVGTYSGWIGFRLTIGAATRKTLWLAYHHGYGGGGPVTRGVIQTARQAVYLPDATFVWTGHTHDEWTMTISRERVADSGRLYHDEQIHIKTPGYKDEYSPHEGWHTERGGPVKPIGSAWLRLWIEHGDKNNGRVRYEVTRATA